MTEPEWEYMVRTTVVELDRTYDSPAMDEETARAIISDPLDGVTQVLFRRCKASQWEAA